STHRLSLFRVRVHTCSSTLFLFFSIVRPPPPRSTLFPYTTLFRSRAAIGVNRNEPKPTPKYDIKPNRAKAFFLDRLFLRTAILRSEEHTSELQSRFDLVCRLLLEKKKKINI